MVMRILQPKNWAIWCILMAINFYAVSTFAQTDAPLARTRDVWKVNYYVSVTGVFSKEPEVGEDGPSVFYHIKRTYEGKATLNYEPRAGDPKAAALYPMFKDPATRVRITINDFINTIYPPVCDEYKSIEETWTADVDSITGDEKSRYPALLMVYNQQLSYKISFPLLYFGSRSFKEIEYKKTEFSNPGRKVTNSTAQRLGFETHQYPNVKGYIEHDIIIRAPWWAELKEEGGVYSWLSPILHPDNPLIDGVPESKDNVNILIHYSLTKASK